MSGLLAVSPHLDDAVFSAGDLIGHFPGATVVTVFAGFPSAGQALTEWDRACGFRSSIEAVTERRNEDELALEQLKARPRFLDHHDRQYGGCCAEATILADLMEVVEDCRPEMIAFPLGLHHPDHLTVSRLMFDLRDALADQLMEWMAWADLPYRALPGVLDDRLEACQRSRAVRPWPGSFLPSADKPAAVARYRSQLRALKTDDQLDLNQVFGVEEYWSIGPAFRPAA